ncbi:type II toxin-antitoxin system HicB family antitoxin [Methanofollis aquaemaris]|uniref:type II toxin-antitoxin system HicB family antitoxin n=1 Tax=Methanofollis aquaemaris TaxID=126734 RepID=UPI002AD43AF6|nr:type II toxin-antitoxin system HicB family antitoxin [Methanofollis aquaemaris]
MDQFSVIVEKADGNYSAYSPDLPGCVVAGASMEEAEERMRGCARQSSSTSRGSEKTAGCSDLIPCVLTPVDQSP